MHLEIRGNKKPNTTDFLNHCMVVSRFDMHLIDEEEDNDRDFFSAFENLPRDMGEEEYSEDF